MLLCASMMGSNLVKKMVEKKDNHLSFLDFWIFDIHIHLYSIFLLTVFTDTDLLICTQIRLISYILLKELNKSSFYRQGMLFEEHPNCEQAVSAILLLIPISKMCGYKPTTFNLSSSFFPSFLPFLTLTATLLNPVISNGTALQHTLTCKFMCRIEFLVHILYLYYVFSPFLLKFISYCRHIQAAFIVLLLLSFSSLSQFIEMLIQK